MRTPTLLTRGMRLARRLGVAACVLQAAGCGNVLDAPLPAGTVDPASFHNAAGAIARYRAVLRVARNAFVTNAVAQGTITDELQDNDLGGVVAPIHPLDERVLPELELVTSPVPTDAGAYLPLSSVRGQGADAIGMLRKYAPDAPRSFVGELHALVGLAEIALAEEMCSGIPLSTLDFEADFTYQPGSTTAQVYEHALALLDSAVVEAADSASILDLARVGRGRALLGLGRFDEAAAAVAEVPEGFAYRFDVDWSGEPNDQGLRGTPPLAEETVADVEGTNGLPYVSSGDPRAAVVRTGTNPNGRPLYAPLKYRGVAPFVLADWLEARLITAEALLRKGDAVSWLAAVNALRATAITPALADTTDPGTEHGRVDLMFRERAFWLFATGHRQGDLRRLARQYGRSQSDVFPVGPYTGGQTYGGDVTVPIPAVERVNPLFTGCINREP